ncbi:MAG: hypothetical protein HRU11_05425 [Parvularculaceae bacterium]|nr:hypothetical protein [Parvularculaceae bacterium]
MSETQRFSSDGGTANGLDAQTALAPFNEAVEASFVELSQTVGEQLARLSFDSRQTVQDMVEEILADFARLAAQRAIGSLFNDPFTERQATSDALSAILRAGVRNG